MKFIILIFAMLFSPHNIEASNRPLNPIWVPLNYAEIINDINPNIDPNKAISIVYSVFQYGIEFNVEPHLILAMLAQESKFESKAISHTKDYSIAQFNVETIKQRKLNKQRLIMDSNYAIFHMVKMLSEIKAIHGKKEVSWYSRYNTSTPSKRKLYEKAVLKYYDKFNFSPIRGVYAK